MARFDKEGAIEKLKELGVELTGDESVADLKALLEDHASDEEDTDEDAEDSSEEEESDEEEGDESEDSEEDEEGAGKKGKFKVFDSNGKVVATAKTKKEAAELAKVYGGKVVKE